MSTTEEPNRVNDEIGQLVLQGKAKGYVTYEELNDALPSNFIAPEQIDGLMNMFAENEIHVVDSALAGEKLVSENSSHGQKEDSPSEDTATAKSENLSVDDPVRMYLREMGTISLLTREGEVTIAKKIEARRLIIMSDVEGVLDNNQKLIPEINSTSIKELIENETITGGMIPKINNCLDVASNGVKGVVIIDGRKNHSILFELLSDKGSGTLIRQ